MIHHARRQPWTFTVLSPRTFPSSAAHRLMDARAEERYHRVQRTLPRSSLRLLVPIAAAAVILVVIGATHV